MTPRQALSIESNDLVAQLSDGATIEHAIQKNPTDAVGIITEVLPGILQVIQWIAGAFGTGARLKRIQALEESQKQQSVAIEQLLATVKLQQQEIDGLGKK